MSGDFDFEPVRGLPAGLPKEERILWQGAPDWWAFAKSALHVRGLAIYFVLLMAWRFGVDLSEGGTLATGLIAAAWVIPMVVIVMGLAFGYALMVSRTTVYSITNERVVFRKGVAFTITATIPFKLIRSADLAVERDGTGIVALEVEQGQRVSWLLFWPHVRPWRMNDPHPAFRAVPEAETVAGILTEALSAHAATEVSTAAADDTGVEKKRRPRVGPRDSDPKHGAQCVN
mmetsp:Transcript_74815/g.103972  ORF Transcript_74815/g.103972 Transcript_74815/m.103972 type:complete len:231 (-) Transcript_74815:16-708(-)